MQLDAKDKIEIGETTPEFAIKSKRVWIGDGHSGFDYHENTITINSSEILLGRNNSTLASSKIKLTGNIELSEFSAEPGAASSFVYSSQISFLNANLALSVTKHEHFSYSQIQRTAKPEASKIWGNFHCEWCISFQSIKKSSLASVQVLLEDVTVQLTPTVYADAVISCSVVNRQQIEVLEMATFFPRILLDSTIGLSMSGSRQVFLESTDFLVLKCGVFFPENSKAIATLHSPRISLSVMIL